MEKLSLREMKVYLSESDPDDLRLDILTLFKEIPSVKEYYLAKLVPAAESTLLEKYKKQVNDEFFPARGHGRGRASVVRKVVSDFKKIAKEPRSVVELLLFHVSTGISFTTAYGDITEAFYASLATSFQQALQLANKHDILDQFETQAETLMEKSQDFGWGLGFAFSDIYYEFYTH